MELTNTQYGFVWGPVSVERAVSDEKKGWVLLLVKTAKYPYGLQVYVTKTGKVRVHSASGEWRPGAENANAPTA